VVPAAPAPVAPAAAAGALSVDSLRQGSFAFNGGTITIAGGVYQFAASQARDPGFGLLTGDADLQGRNTLVFEIKGSLTRLGGYARFIAQVYDDGDNDSTPSVMLDPIELTNNYQTITVNLQNRVDMAKKVQFLLVTDNGNCRVDIRNLRFE
jgi:hypothetical protein